MDDSEIDVVRVGIEDDIDDNDDDGEPKREDSSQELDSSQALAVSVEAITTESELGISLSSYVKEVRYIFVC